MGRSAWIGVVLALAAVTGLLAIQLMQQRRDHERVLVELRVQGDAARARLDRVANEQEQIRRALVESKDSLAVASDRASLLMREDLAAVGMMRTAITEYYLSMGRMPATMAEAGLPAPERYRGKTLKSADLLADGMIELVFDAQSGVDGGRVRFVPDTTHADATGIQWRCQAPDYPLIARVLPTCEYTPAGATPIDAAPSVLAAPPETP